MKECPLSIEELWLQLQLRNIRCIKLCRSPRFLRGIDKYGDSDDTLWSEILVRQHDGYVGSVGQTYEVYTLLIDKVIGFAPLKVKDHEVSPWYFLSLDNSGNNYNNYWSHMASDPFVISLRYKDKLLLSNKFNNPQDLSGDSLLNW